MYQKVLSLIIALFISSLFANELINSEIATLDSWQAAGNVSYRSDISVKNDGSGAIQLFASAWGDTTSHIIQSANTTTNTDYQLSWYVNPGTHFENYFGFEIVGDSSTLKEWRNVHIKRDSTEAWIRITASFNSKTNSNITIKFTSYSDAWIAIDNIKLRVKEKVYNPNFNTLSNWNTTGFAEYTSTRSAENDSSGSVQVRAPEDQWGSSASSISQVVHVQRGTEYSLNWKTHAIQYDDTSAAIYYGYTIHELNGTPLVISTPENAYVYNNTTNTWSNKTINFYSGDNDDVIITLHSYAEDWVSFDNVSLKKYEAISNPSFFSSKGWQTTGHAEYQTSTSSDNDGSGAMQVRALNYEWGNPGSAIFQEVHTEKNTNYKLSWRAHAIQPVYATNSAPIYYGYSIETDSGTVLKAENPLHVWNNKENIWEEKVVSFNSGDNEKVVIKLHSHSTDWVSFDNVNLQFDYSNIKSVQTADGKNFYPIGWYTYNGVNADMNPDNDSAIKATNINTIHFCNAGEDSSHIGNFVSQLKKGQQDEVKSILSLSGPHIVHKIDSSKKYTYDYSEYKKLIDANDPTRPMYDSVWFTFDTSEVNGLEKIDTIKNNKERDYEWHEFLGSWINDPNINLYSSSILGWQIGDEYSDNMNNLKQANDCIALIKQKFPDHQIWQVHTADAKRHGNVAPFMEKTDVYSCDSYRNTVETIEKNTNPEYAYIRDLNSNTKLCTKNSWIGNVNVTLATHSPSEKLVLPTPNQYRWHVFTALTKGHRGTLGWFFPEAPHLIYDSLQLPVYRNFIDQGVTPTNKILNTDLRFALESGWNVGHVTTNNTNLSKILLYDSTKTEHYLVVTNEDKVAINFNCAISNITTPINDSTITLIDDSTFNIPIEKSGNIYKFSDSIDGFGVKVYELK